MWTISKDKSWLNLEKEFDWVKRMEEVPQDKIYHAEGNVAIHTQMVLAALENEPGFQKLGAQEKEILWASALLHDVEKYSTTVLEEDGSISSKGHAKKGAMKARQFLYRDLPAPFYIREQIVALVRHHGLPIWLFEKPDPLKALIMASMDLNTEWLALLARADMLGRICEDQEAMLYRIDCFEEFCREQGCWGQARSFVSEDARMYYLQKENAYVDYVPFDTPLMEMVLMSGLPGAGKDTFIKKNFPEMEVISLDDIRREWGIKPTDKSGNGRVIQEAKERARVLLRKKISFVWNATNTTSQMRMQLIELFSTYKAKVRVVYIESPYADLCRQNRGREAIVPDQVLEKLINKLEVPALWEGHTVSYFT
ncbi:HDIG domain-containing protein [Pedobacter steynii]|uniref:HDIG domain-containing protein n=2 Tax=Pedobacter steynii TaxID=430522 RepID=A0A1G9SHA1_9SPHI|nr:AAA family ATPase [Pedobacter steynii]SDM34771.1 HDIG domain-containing protein [Pedobacter steynii]